MRHLNRALTNIPADPRGYAGDLAEDLAAETCAELGLALEGDAYDDLVSALAEEIEDRQCGDCLRSFGPPYEGCRCGS